MLAVASRHTSRCIRWARVRYDNHICSSVGNGSACLRSSLERLVSSQLPLWSLLAGMSFWPTIRANNSDHDELNLAWKLYACRAEQAVTEGA